MTPIDPALGRRRFVRGMLAAAATAALPALRGLDRLRARGRAQAPKGSGGYGPLEPLRSFILPGGSITAAWLHLARTICRRAERSVVSLARCERLNPQVVIYLNRLSDLLFVMARSANGNGTADVLWVPGRGAKS